MKDDLFIRTHPNCQSTVPMTKEAVRCLSLSRLDLSHAKTFIDVGSGTGSICIEASLNYPHLQSIAIERKADAITLIKLNQEKFKVNNLQVIHGVAPLSLPYIQPATVDAIFIGGNGGHLEDIIQWSYDLLIDKGRLVLNFILINNLIEAVDILRSKNFHQLDVCQLQVSHLTGLGTGDYFKPNNSTYIISALKGTECAQTEVIV